ncbi:MAG: cryptochrome/photolyase family protein [Pseudomonadota bacterium]
MADTALVWLRHDLRITDNPALTAASRHRNLLVVHLLEREPATAADWWRARQLETLAADLAAGGGRLVRLEGDPEAVIPRLCTEHGIGAVYWNRRYTPGGIARDSRLKSRLSNEGRHCRTFNAALLREPWTLRNRQGSPYRVFTPFWRALSSELTPPEPRPAPQRIPPPPQGATTNALEPADHLPTPAWWQKLAAYQEPGERAAGERLRAFITDAVDHYPEQRDVPAVAGTSRLSADLHHGALSPGQILAALHERFTHPLDSPGAATFLTEIGWREFSHAILYHFPESVEAPLDPKFNDFPWQSGETAAFAAWRRGETGIPLVDAGMRELWTTGWMHNRVRMVVASWLTKNLGHHWRDGAAWFLETLVDADTASNTLGWQWVAGCGADAAPYFRIVNPVRQAERFDPEGAYIARWVPELSLLPPRWRREPWKTPFREQNRTGFTPGRDYPPPQADPAESRRAALARFREFRI